MIEVEGPDGAIYEFPPNTPPDVIQRQMRARYQPQQSRGGNGLQETQGRQAQVAPQPQTSWLDEAYGFTNAARNALMFNTADEVGAGIGAAFGQDYDTSLANQRAQQREYAAERPISNVAATVAGTVPLMFLPGGATRAPTMLGSMARGAGTGAAVGAASGFGAGEDGLENRAKSAAIGGGVGGLLGGAAVPVAKAVSPLARAIGRFAADESGAAAGSAAANADDAALALIARKIGQDSRGRGEKLAETIARMRGEIDRRGAVGKDTSLLSVGGKNMRDLAKTIGSRPGDAKELMETRATEKMAGTIDRVRRDIDRVIGGGKSVQELIDARSAAASPYYEAAKQSGAVVDTAPLLASIDSKLATAAGPKATALERVRGYLFDNAGRPRVGIDELHESKLAIDNLIDNAPTDSALGRGTVRDLRAVQDELLALMDQASPDQYAIGRAKWREASPAIEASQELGKRVAETSFGGDATIRALKNPEQLDELRVLIGNKADDFYRSILDEKNTYRAFRDAMPSSGAQTMRLMAANEELAGLGDIIAAAPKSKEGLVLALARFLQRGPSEEVGRRTADILTRPNPNSNAVQQLAEILAQSARRSARESTGAGVLSGQLAAAIANMNGRQ